MPFLPGAGFLSIRDNEMPHGPFSPRSAGVMPDSRPTNLLPFQKLIEQSVDTPDNAISRKEWPEDVRPASP